VLPGSSRHIVPGGLSRKRSVTDGPLLCGVCSEPTRLHGTPPHAVYGLGLGLRYTVWRRTAWWIERVTYCSQNPNASCHATFQVSPPPGALGAAGACAAASWEVAPPPLVLWPLPPVAAVAAVGAAATAAAFLGAAAFGLGRRPLLLGHRGCGRRWRRSFARVRRLRRRGLLVPTRPTYLRIQDLLAVFHTLHPPDVAWSADQPHRPSFPSFSANLH
jgi:hypothetical protein